jgi:hypothetical protein
MASRKNRSTWLFILVAVLVLIFMPMVSGTSWQSLIAGWVGDYQEAAEAAARHGDDDDDDDEAEHGDAEPLLVELDDEVVDAAGIQILNLESDLHFAESRAYARVVDVRDLIQRRSQLKQLELTLSSAQLKEQAELKELNRLRKLAAGTGSVASKNVSYAEASWQEARSHVQAARLQLDNAKTEISQGWGPVIAGWLSDEKSEEYSRLVSRQDTLIEITLPVALSLPADVNVIRVSRQGERASARKAYFVSPAYVANYAAQGETYYFRMATGKLRLGMRLHAWIPQNQEGQQGFFIPEQAIVWYAGKPWTYVQEDEAVYRRRPLFDGESVAGGIFIQSGFNAGDALVVAGSQMLLSEEFRWQIMDEDDD